MKYLHHAAFASAIVLSLIAACSGNDKEEKDQDRTPPSHTSGGDGSAGEPTQTKPEPTTSGGGGEAGETSGVAGAPGEPARPPLYALVSMVFGMSEGESSTSYVILLDSLDRTENVTLGSGREFPGYAPVSTVDGKLFAGSGEAPTVTGFDVSDELKWKQRGVVSFGNFTSVPLEGNVLADAQHGYVALGDKNWVAYDPTTLEVGALIELPSDIPTLRGALTVQRGYGQEIAGKSIYQPYYWADAMFQSYSQESQIAVFDTEKAAFTTVMAAPCPHLHITTADEDGNLYFSNGVASIASSVLNAKQPRNCMVRVKPGAKTIDADFTTDFEELTEGREGSNLFYIKDGLALINVYHAERDKLAADAAYNTVMYSGSYHLWTLDLKTMQAKIMDGIDYTGGQFVAFRLGQRLFITIPKADYSSTAVYEVSDAGVATKKFDVQGWTFKMMKVR